MSSEPSTPQRKLPIVKLAIAGVVLLVIGVLVLRGVKLEDVKRYADEGIGMIRDAGPATFFAAMALLPAIGFPMMMFTIPAGQAFAPQLGMPAVIAISMAMIAINLAIGYWVARYAFRPVLMGLLKRYGYSVPRVTPDNALTVTILVRCTPGPPYALQAFILGCAEVPFRMYMVVAWLAILPYAIGGIVLGQGVFSGDFGALLTGVALMAVAAAVIHWLRRKYFQKRAG
jgi:uncharacterized membrane protein YdjX (TVP38/TMEM64 family)